MITYFISFSYVNGNGSGFGNIEYKRNDEIKNINDIQAIARDTESQFSLPEGSVAIINFIKLP